VKIAALLLIAANLILAAEWPRFRGPLANGVADDPSLPDVWSGTENVKWKTPIPGSGWSSPIVWGSRVFVTSVTRANSSYKLDRALYGGTVEQTPPSDEHRRMVYCLDFKTGKILWSRELHRGVPLTSHHPKNSFAAETPVTDGQRLFVVFGNLGVFALDLDGKPLWSAKLGPFSTRHG
jgi:outer membrane protein assembly factor BamB